MTQISTFIGGIDIAKEKLDAAVHGMPGGIVVENAEAGWEQLAQFFKQAGVGKVGVEATGGYERRVVRYLQRAGFDVVVLQPNQVRAFAKMRLQRAKNDRIDAHLIAACTYVLDARARAPRDERFDELADHLTFIEQIESDATRIKTRLEHIGDRRQRGIYARMIKRLETLAKAERLRLMKHLAVHPDLVRRVELVSSIPGCGEKTALAIVIRMPELGQISREEVASLAGLAPFVHQSGKHQGKMHIGGGREPLRRALYKAVLPAATFWNPALMALSERLKSRGKGHLCAQIACARKLLIFANTVVRRDTPWEARPIAA
jgi:transposase